MEEKEKCKYKGLCSLCPYKYCIDDEKDPKEDKDRKDYLDKYYTENKDKVNQAHRNAYVQKKKNGICVRCGQKATHGLYCRDHAIAQKKRSRERAMTRKRDRHERGLIPEIRKESGLCLWCGEKATGGTLACDIHRNLFQKASLKSGRRVYWRQENNLVFQGGRNTEMGKNEFKEFKNWLREKELSENTIKSYLNDLKVYKKEKGNDYSKEAIVDFKWKMIKSRKAKTVNHYITAIKEYLRFQGQACDVKKIKVQKINAVENVISEEQFEMLVKSLKSEGNEKYAAYIAIPAKTGARVSEFLKFTKKDLNRGYAEFYTKGKSENYIFS